MAAAESPPREINLAGIDNQDIPSLASKICLQDALDACSKVIESLVDILNHLSSRLLQANFDRPRHVSVFWIRRFRWVQPGGRYSGRTA